MAKDKNLIGKTRYDVLNEGLEEVLTSSFYDELKNIKIDITLRELQLDNIDKGIDNINIEALKVMEKQTSNLGIELREVFEKEFDKNPESQIDNLNDLNEKLSYNIDALKNKEPYIEDSLIFAKSFNEIILSNIEDYDFSKLPEDIRQSFDKNEEILFTINETVFINNKFEYISNDLDYGEDLDTNFEMIKNEFNIVIEAYRKIEEGGFELENYSYLDDKLKDTITSIATYTIDDNSNMELRQAEFQDYIENKSDYIKEHISSLNIELGNIFDLEVEANSENILDHINLEVEEKEVDFDFDF